MCRNVHLLASLTLNQEYGAGSRVMSGQDGGALWNAENAGMRRGESDAAGDPIRLADGGGDARQRCSPRGAENAGGGYVVERLPVKAAFGVVVGDIRVAAAGTAIAQSAAIQFLNTSAGYA